MTVTGTESLTAIKTEKQMDTGMEKAPAFLTAMMPVTIMATPLAMPAERLMPYMEGNVRPSPPPPQRRRGLAAATPTITHVCCGFTVAVLSWVGQRQKGKTAVFSQQN